MRILLIEDDPTTTKSIELMLGHANLNVFSTSFGEEGIELAKLYDYDLILLDLTLPRHRPFPLHRLEFRVQPGHVAQSFLVLGLVSVIRHGVKIRLNWAQSGCSVVQHALACHFSFPE